MPGDKPRAGDKPDLPPELLHKGEAALKRPQIVSPAGGGTGNYQGGGGDRHEAGPRDGYAQDRGTDGGAASTHQEERPKLPDKPSAGGASQLDRGTSL